MTEVKKRVVFCYPQPDRDQSLAKEHGEVVFLFKDWSGVGSPFNPDECVKRIKTRLDEIGFDPINDLMGLTGTLLHTCLFCAVVTTRYKSVKGVMFNAKTSTYVVRQIRL